MNTKILEIRDDGTFIPVLCVDLNPPRECPGELSEDETRRLLDAAGAQLYYLRRCGYRCDGRPNIGITHLSADGDRFSNDPWFWNGRTWPTAHHYIIENWDTLKDGDVVDVEWIKGESEHPKKSARFGEAQTK